MPMGTHRVVPGESRDDVIPTPNTRRVKIQAEEHHVVDIYMCGVVLGAQGDPGTLYNLAIMHAKKKGCTLLVTGLL